MARYVTIAKTTDVAPGRVKYVEIEDYRLALCNVDGEFFAIDDVCTHDGGSLDQGELYDNVIDLRRHSFSWRSIGRRLRANRVGTARWLNFVRAVSSEGFGRIRHDSRVRRLLDHDPDVRSFFEGESDVLPAFYTDRMRKSLGPWWHALPEGALRHDPNAYLKAHEASAGAEHTVQARAGVAARRPNGP